MLAPVWGNAAGVGLFHRFCLIIHPFVHTRFFNQIGLGIHDGFVNDRSGVQIDCRAWSFSADGE